MPWPQNYKIFSNVYASGKVIFPKNTGWLQRAYYDGRYFNITIKGFRLSSCPYQPDSGLGDFNTILLAAWDRAFGRDDDGSRPVQAVCKVLVWSVTHLGHSCLTNTSDSPVLCHGHTSRDYSSFTRQRCHAIEIMERQPINSIPKSGAPVYKTGSRPPILTGRFKHGSF